MLTATISSILFFLKIEIKSFLTISKSSNVFFNASEFFIFSSFSKDCLALSKLSLENDEKLKNTETLKKVIEHLDIVSKDILSIFKKNNIEPIKSINEKLDPNIHQAMMEVEDETKEEGLKKKKMMHLIMVDFHLQESL